MRRYEARLAAKDEGVTGVIARREFRALPSAPKLPELEIFQVNVEALQPEILCSASATAE